MGKFFVILFRIIIFIYKGLVMIKIFIYFFSIGFLGGVNDSSLFNEILFKFNESRKYSDLEEDVSDILIDIVYNSVIGLENSLLEWKNKFDIDFLSYSFILKDFGFFSDNLNILKDFNSMDYEILF